MSDPKRLMSSGGLGQVLLRSGLDTGPGPDDAQREALWAELVAELPGLGAAAGATGAAGAGATSTKGWLAGLKAASAAALAKGALVAVVAGAVGTAGSMAVRPWLAVHTGAVATLSSRATPRPELESSTGVAPASREAWTVVLPDEVPVTDVPIELDPPPLATVAHGPGHPTHAPRARPAAPPMAEATAAAPPARSEAALLLDARRALRGADCAAALSLVDEASARFPAGALAEEREVLGIQALACAGRSHEAEAHRAAFVHDHPDSAYDVTDGRGAR